MFVYYLVIALGLIAVVGGALALRFRVGFTAWTVRIQRRAFGDSWGREIERAGKSAWGVVVPAIGVMAIGLVFIGTGISHLIT